MSDPNPRPTEAQLQALQAAIGRIDRVNDWLQLGGAVAPAEYGRLADAGITHLIDLREDHESDADQAALEGRGITRLQVPVPNHTAPTLEALVEVKSWLASQGSDTVAYVHCVGGFGRAATVAVGLLLLDSVPLDDAIEQVRAARPEVRINEVQLAWLQGVEQGVQDSASSGPLD